MKQIFRRLVLLADARRTLAQKQYDETGQVEDEELLEAPPARPRASLPGGETAAERYKNGPEQRRQPVLRVQIFSAAGLVGGSDEEPLAVYCKIRLVKGGQKAWSSMCWRSAWSTTSRSGQVSSL